MKYKHSVLEAGIILFIFGLSMILFPSIFEHSTIHHYEHPDNIYTGISLMIIGSILILAKYLNTKKDNKNNDNH